MKFSLKLLIMLLPATTVQGQVTLTFSVTPSGPTDPSSGLTQTTCDTSGVPAALAGAAVVLFGTFPSSVAAQVCSAIVNTGQFTFPSSIESYGQTITPTLDLSATGGCGSAGDINNPDNVEVNQ